MLKSGKILTNPPRPSLDRVGAKEHLHMYLNIMDENVGKYKPYNRSNISFAREMRKNLTPAEEKMWQEILKYRP